MEEKKRHSRALAIIAIIVAVVLLLPFTIYIPFVQSWACRLIEKEASAATGWDVMVGGISLDFPLDLAVNDVVALDNADTIIAVGEAGVEVSVLPLLGKRVEASRLRLADVCYRITTSDTSLCLNARVERCVIDNGVFDFDKNRILASNSVIEGGDIVLDYDSSRAVSTPPDTSATQSLAISLFNTSLRDIRYRMRLVGTIDSLDTKIGEASLDTAAVDLAACTVDCGTLRLDSVDVAYVFPSEPSAQTTESPTDTLPSAPWTITGRRLELHGGKALYAMTDHSPLPGIDFEYISLDNIDIAVNDFYNRGTALRVPIEKIAAVERSGFAIDSISGLFVMDSVAMTAKDFALHTPLSQATLDASASLAALALDPSGSLNLALDASLNLNEVAKLFPMLAIYTRNIPAVENSDVSFNASGTVGDIKIKRATIEMPRYASLSADGRLRNITAANRSGNISLKGNLANINFVKPTFLDVKMRREVEFPPMKVNGELAFAGENMSGDLAIVNGSGNMSLEADLKSRSEGYALNLDLDRFPVNSLLPYLGVGEVSATLALSGNGFNPLLVSSNASAAIDIPSIIYSGKQFNDISARADIADGLLRASLTSPNPDVDFALDATATITDDRYEYRLNADVRNLDFMALNLSESTLGTKMNVKSSGVVDLRNATYDLDAQINNLNVDIFDYNIATDRISANLLSDADTTKMHIVNRDFVTDISANCLLDTLLLRLSLTADELAQQFDRKFFTFSRLDSVLPQFSIKSTLGRDNIVHQYCDYNDIEFNSVSLTAQNDSVFSLSGNINRLELSSLRLDTINLSIREKKEALIYDMHIGNRPGNLDQMAKTNIYGFISDNYFNVLLDQRNRAGRTGFYIGMNGRLTDSLFVASLFPEYPIIGFDEWELNGNNYVEYDYKNGLLAADVWLSHENSVLSVASGENYDVNGQEDIEVIARNIDLAQWIQFSPFAPDVSGDVNADIHLSYDKKNYWGDCALNIANLRYNGSDIGDVGFSTTLEVNPVTNLTDALASLSLNGEEAVSASGVVNDSTISNPLKFNLQVKRLPLKVIEAFVPKDMVKANGFLAGNLSMNGTPSKPIFNGSLSCDSAFITLPAYGCRLNFSKDSVRIDSSVVIFDKFDLLGTNGNLITIDGFVDINDMENPYSDISIRGRNVEIINSKKHAGAEVFGKGYIDLDATAVGRMNRLVVNADIGLLESTNVTYIMTSAVGATSHNTGDDLIEFVMFNDTISGKKTTEETGAFSMNLHANLNIEPGAMFTVYISTNGNDRAMIRGNGALSYFMNSQGDMQLTGRYNIDEGYVRYSPPLIGTKNFDIDRGSYINWGGDMLNPQLHITAQTKQTNTVIAEGENSQRVKFIITAEINNTLNNLDLKFDLTAENNLSIQSELLSMSQEQRSNQAINLLLYNNYTGSITSSVSSPNSNMLYSFLSSQLNNWASKVVKGVDISLGIKEYNSSTTRSMNYSYQISKSLFDNRFKMSVGGNYDTAYGSDNSIAQNLLNDISFEYLITPSGTMSVQIYSHLTHDDIYKDNVTETGAAFVIRRKLNTLRNLFNFKRSETDVVKSDSDTIKAPSIK